MQIAIWCKHQNAGRLFYSQYYKLFSLKTHFHPQKATKIKKNVPTLFWNPNKTVVNYLMAEQCQKFFYFDLRAQKKRNKFLHCSDILISSTIEFITQTFHSNVLIAMFYRWKFFGRKTFTQQIFFEFFLYFYKLTKQKQKRLVVYKCDLFFFALYLDNDDLTLHI